MDQAKKIGLIAGYGVFPQEIARRIKDAGHELHVVAAREETHPDIEKFSDSIVWLHVGQLGGMLRAFKHAGVTDVIMAGKVRKLHLFRNFLPDFKAVATLAKLPDRKDDTILNAIADMLKGEGMCLQDQTAYIPDLMAMDGQMFGPKLKKLQKVDVLFGSQQAKRIAAIDVGQTVVVQDRAVLAVEAIEGTDLAIQRGGELGNGQAVVVKVAKPNQDMRFDVPAVGPDTLDVMNKYGCKVLAMEAGKTILLDKEVFSLKAKQYGIAVVGFSYGK